MGGDIGGDVVDSPGRFGGVEGLDLEYLVLPGLVQDFLGLHRGVGGDPLKDSELELVGVVTVDEVAEVGYPLLLIEPVIRDLDDVDVLLEVVEEDFLDLGVVDGLVVAIAHEGAVAGDDSHAVGAEEAGGTIRPGDGGGLVVAVLDRDEGHHRLSREPLMGTHVADIQGSGLGAIGGEGIVREGNRLEVPRASSSGGSPFRDELDPHLGQEVLDEAGGILVGHEVVALGDDPHGLLGGLVDHSHDLVVDPVLADVLLHGDGEEGVEGVGLGLARAHREVNRLAHLVHSISLVRSEPCRSRIFYR